MRRDKFITVQKAVTVDGSTGGSRSTWVPHWQGWAQVKDMTYKTVLEQSQWTGNKSIQVNIRKFPITDAINTSMRVLYRDEVYLIGAKIELDRFTLQLLAITKQHG
jgi:SPP1 family predicted phage head-tail adaptor